MLRSLATQEAETSEATKRLLRLLQYNPDALQGDCSSLQVVDACRGTGVGRTYIGEFKPFEGDCSGEFEPGMPIYWNEDENPPLYMYPIDVYPEHWSLVALRGLVRWRIVSFKNFDDKTTCRRSEANIFQIDFAADGQPYNYYPTISCFDEFADDFSGYKVSTITIICNDIVVSAGNDEIPGDGGGGGGNTGLVIGIIVALVAVAALGYWCTHIALDFR
jgi:hypothetical protein